MNSITSQMLQQMRPKIQQVIKRKEVKNDEPRIRFGGKWIEPTDPYYPIAKKMILKR